jgi:hypothetical protein
MVALLCFPLRLLASPFKSASRLEAENAALRPQLIVFQRKLRCMPDIAAMDLFVVTTVGFQLLYGTSDVALREMHTVGVRGVRLNVASRASETLP